MNVIPFIYMEILPSYIIMLSHARGESGQGSGKHTVVSPHLPCSVCDSCGMALFKTILRPPKREAGFGI